VVIIMPWGDSVLPHKHCSLAKQVSTRRGLQLKAATHRSLSSTDTHRGHEHLNGVEAVKKGGLPPSGTRPTLLFLRRNSFNPVAICRAPVQRNHRKKRDQSNSGCELWLGNTHLGDGQGRPLLH